MSDRRHWTANDDEILREHFTAGRTLGETARLMGWAPATISKKAKRLGIEWSRKHLMAAAITTSAMSNIQKRAELETKMLDVSLMLIEQYGQPYEVFNFGGKENTFETAIVANMPSDAQRAVASAIGIFADRALKLAETNNQVRDLSDVDAWIENLTGIPDQSREKTTP